MDPIDMNHRCPMHPRDEYRTAVHLVGARYYCAACASFMGALPPLEPVLPRSTKLCANPTHSEACCG